MQTFRGDVEGLRALAVFAVLLFHFDFNGLQGGFLGVDIFFVISGYVISKGIRSRAHAGTFTLSDFYTRRFRRILPALIATILIVLIAGFLFFPVVLYKELSLSAIFAALSVSNFYFPGATDYFGHQGIEMPLLHMWSLSVEEQFYLVWPLVFVLLIRKVNGNKHFAVISALVALFLVVSVAWGLRDQRVAFFMAPSRFFEFLLGAWVVSAEAKWSWKNPRIYDALFIVGLAVCVTAIFGIDETITVPGIMLLIPDLSAALIIFAGSRSQYSVVFSNTITRFFGKISYSLYLVHWPLVVFYKHVYEYQLGLPDKFGLLIASIVLAYCLWRYVEQPFRRSPNTASQVSNKTFYVGLASTLSAVVVFSGFVYSNEGLPWRMSKTSQEIYQNYKTAHARSDACKPNEKLPPGFFCFGSQNTGAAEAILIGDSHVNNFQYGLSELFQKLGIRAVYRVNHGCPPIEGVRAIHPILPFWHLICADQNGASFNYAKEEHFSVVILAGRWAWYTNLDPLGRIDSNSAISLGFKPGDERTAEHSMLVFKTKIESTISDLVKARKKVIIFGQAPEVGFDIERCLFNPDFFNLEYAGCAPVSTEVLRDYIAATNNVLKTIASKYPKNVLFLDSSLPLCDEKCVYLEGNVPLYFDDNHLSSAGSLLVVRKFSDEISRFIGRKAPANNVSSMGGF